MPDAVTLAWGVPGARTDTLGWAPFFLAIVAWFVAFVGLVYVDLHGEEVFFVYWAPLPFFVAFAPLLLNHLFGDRWVSPLLPTVLLAVLLELGWWPWCPLFNLASPDSGSVNDTSVGLALTNLITVVVRVGGFRAPSPLRTPSPRRPVPPP